MSEEKEPYGNDKASIYKKLLQITDEATQIPKNGYNEFSKYKYVKAVDALGAIRKLLILHGVHLTISETGCKRYRDGKNFHTEIECEATFVDVDNPASYHRTKFFSVSADTLDKDIFKAKTNGLKYLFTQEFKLVTDDFVDTEQGGKHELPEEEPEPITKKQIEEIDKLKEKLNMDEIKYKNELMKSYKKAATDRLDTKQAGMLIARLKTKLEYGV